MKNIFRILMAAAVLLTASCAKEEISSTIGGGEVEVTFTANLAGLGTRAIADGNTVDCVYLAIFDANNDAYLSELTVDAGYPVSNGQATIPVVLLKDKKYDLVFWAQKDGTGAYTLDLENRQVKANYGVDHSNNFEAWSNNEERDAFFNISNDWTAGKDNTTFELRRPFAQINVGNSDADVKYAKQNGSEIKQSAMTVTTKVYDTIELVNGSLTGTEVSAEFVLRDIPAETVKGTVDPTHDALLNASEEYNYLAMNYLLVNDRQLVDLVFNFTDGTTTFERKYYQVPVQRNYRTNILGQIISSPMDFTVEIKPGFDGEYNDVWDGQTVAAPAYDDATKTYTIVKPSELAWLASAVNGTLETRAVAADSFKGKTFVLTKDIDLGYKEWTPIGNASNNFQGTFDGNGKTISSLYINTPSESYVGLFGMTTNGEIKNLTVKDAKVTGYLAVGVVAGCPYTSKYTNITVTGHIEVNGMAYVGGVGGRNAYASWDNITVEADETSYVKADSREDGKAYRTYVGGVVGFNGEGGHSFKNITSNINVEGSTIDVGGLFGIAHYGNKFENCSCSGNVTITNASEAADAEEMGGIAGVWHNGGADVVMTDCSFTGNLSANVAATVWYGGLVGKPYSESGNGKLILNGLTMTSNGVGEKEGEANVYYITSDEGLIAIAQEIEAGNIPLDATIELCEDIDLSALTRTVESNWTPIGTEEKPFTGTFNGKDRTIKNLALVEAEAKEGKAFIGFFGYAKNATIKNVTFENVYINIPCLDIDHSQGHIGAVAGSLEGTSTIENVTVKGDIQVYATQDANGASRVAVVAGGNSYGNVTMKNVHVIANEGSSLIANNNTGALAGQLQGKSVFENCSSNIDVTVNKFFAGGIIGLAAGDQLFVNCHTTGNVAVVAGREGRAHDQYRVGGIAGGWSDGAKNVCTLVNCSYTGNISGKNSDGSVANPLDYWGYVGRGYTLNGCQGSKVIIDGTEFVQKYNTAAEAGIYTINGCTPVSTADELVAALEANEGVYLLNDIKIDPAAMSNAYGKTGINVKNGQTIDGGGHTLNIKGAGGTWDSGINTTGGLIKNITVTGSFRGIFINHTSTHSEKVVLKNVTLTGVTYTISCDQGLYQGIEATDCTFNGWTSFAKTAGEAQFVNCSFGVGNGYKYCRPYSKTEFVNCTFCPGYTVDQSKAEVTFTNCTWNE